MPYKNKRDLLTINAEKISHMKISRQAQELAKHGVNDYLAVTLAILFNPVLDKDLSELTQDMCSILMILMLV